jgi:release factor glutamine methyltransferase
MSALQSAKQRLRHGGIEDAGLEAEVLLRFILNTDRAHLYQHLNSPLADDAMNQLYRLVRRRLSHEPSAYITGHREFYGLDFQVNRDVLIPRPETETLVEAAIELAGQLGPRDADGEPAVQIADIGTGSGAVAIALAVNLPSAHIFATDISPAALEVARANAERHGVGERIEFLQGDLLEPLRTPVHLIVANLPYVRTEDWRELPAELRLHEPRLALDGGDDGLDLIRRLFNEAPRVLAPGGAICLEFGTGQQNAILAIARASFASVTIRPDLAGRPRVLVAR